MAIKIINVKKGPDLWESQEGPEAVIAARRLAASPEIAETALASDLNDVMNVGSPFLAGNWKDLINKLKALLLGYQKEVVDTEISWLPVSMYKIYCPKVEKAKATLHFGSDTQSETSSTIQIFGIGGGSTFTTELSESDEYEVENKNQEVRYEFRCTWEKLKITRRNETPAFIHRLKDVDFNNSRIVTGDLPDAVNAHNQAQTQEFLIQPGVLATKKLSIKAGTSSKISNGLKLEKFGIEVGMEISTAYHRELSYTYVLPGGHNYRAYRPDGFSYWVWELI